MAAPDTAGPGRSCESPEASGSHSSRMCWNCHFGEPEWRLQDQPKLELIPPRAWSGSRGNDKPRVRDSIPGDAAGEKPMVYREVQKWQHRQWEKNPLGVKSQLFPALWELGARAWNFLPSRRGCWASNPTFTPGSTW